MGLRVSSRDSDGEVLFFYRFFVVYFLLVAPFLHIGCAAVFSMDMVMLLSKVESAFVAVVKNEHCVVWSLCWSNLCVTKKKNRNHGVFIPLCK